MAIVRGQIQVEVDEEGSWGPEGRSSVAARAAPPQ